MPEFLYIVHPPRPTFPADATPEEIEIIGEHFTYLEAKLEAGELILVGRTQDAPPMGLAIFEADSAEDAQNFLRDDPAVAKGVFSGEVRPYFVALMRGRDE